MSFRRFPLVIALLLATAALALPPSGTRLQDALTAPLTADPVRKNFDSLGTTLVDAIDTQNTKKTDQITQAFVVTNLDDTTNICVGSVSVGAGETCNETLCDTEAKWTAQGYAGKMNCTNGDASQGSIVPAGGAREFRYDGTRCVCMVASGAGTVGQVERVVR